MTHVVVCHIVGKEEAADFFSGALIRSCEVCAKDCWLSIDSLLRFGDNDDMVVRCVECVADRHATIALANARKNVAELLNRIQKGDYSCSK